MFHWLEHCHRAILAAKVEYFARSWFHHCLKENWFIQKEIGEDVCHTVCKHTEKDGDR